MSKVKEHCAFEKRKYWQNCTSLKESEMQTLSYFLAIVASGPTSSEALLSIVMLLYQESQDLALTRKSNLSLF